MKTPSQVIAELDAAHARAKDAFERRDLAAYRELFAPGLAYRQVDGRLIGRDQLMGDVAAQFRRVGLLRSWFSREQMESDGDRAVEVLIQTAFVSFRAFLVVHVTWRLIRRGRYTWRWQGGRWQIEAAEVLEENVSPRRVSFGFGAPFA